MLLRPEDRVFDKDLTEGLLEECEDPPRADLLFSRALVESLAVELSVPATPNGICFFPLPQSEHMLLGRGPIISIRDAITCTAVNPIIPQVPPKP